MKSWNRKILMATLALAASPLLGLSQGIPPAGPQAAPAPVRPEIWRDRGGRDWERGGEFRGHGGRHRWQRRHYQRNMAMWLKNPAVRERLGITAEQAANIESQSMEFQKTRIRDRADIQVKRIELRQLLGAEKPDRAAIDKKLRELNEVELAAKKSMIDYRLAQREFFTPEQREKMRQMFQERGQRRGPRPMPPQGMLPPNL